MPNIAIDSAVLYPNVTFVRWKAHQDWVTQVTFYRSVSVHISLTKKTELHSSNVDSEYLQRPWNNTYVCCLSFSLWPLPL